MLRHVNVILSFVIAVELTVQTRNDTVHRMFSKQPRMNGSQEVPLLLSEKGTVEESQQESSGPVVDLNMS